MRAWLPVTDIIAFTDVQVIRIQYTATVGINVGGTCRDRSSWRRETEPRVLARAGRQLLG
jgi:hypothetical protein